MAEAAFQDDRQKGDFKSKGPELLVDLADVHRRIKHHA